jgi:hypothetical protein
MSIAEEIAALVAEGLTERDARRALLELNAYALSWDYAAMGAAADVHTYAGSWDHRAALAGNPAVMDTNDLPF